MDYRVSAAPRRSPIGTLLGFLFALIGCTRGERPASSSDTAAPTTSSGQPSTGIPAKASSTALGFDSLTTRQVPGSTCYTSARWVVVAVDHEVGSDLYVRPRIDTAAAPRCDADSLRGDMVFRTGEAVSRHPDAQNFMGLKGDLLVAWDGTGGASDLYVYDLQKRAKALVVEGVDENLQWLSPMAVAMWVTKAYAERAAAAGCPDTMPANPAQLDSLMSLDLETLVLRPTGRYRCIVGQ